MIILLPAVWEWGGLLYGCCSWWWHTSPKGARSVSVCGSRNSSGSAHCVYVVLIGSWSLRHLQSTWKWGAWYSVVPRAGHFTGEKIIHYYYYYYYLSPVWQFLKGSLWSTFPKYHSSRVLPLGPLCLWKEEKFETVLCDLVIIISPEMVKRSGTESLEECWFRFHWEEV